MPPRFARGRDAPGFGGKGPFRLDSIETRSSGGPRIPHAKPPIPTRYPEENRLPVPAHLLPTPSL